MTRRPTAQVWGSVRWEIREFEITKGNRLYDKVQRDGAGSDADPLLPGKGPLSGTDRKTWSVLARYSVECSGAYIETEALLGFDKNDYEAGGTGWSGHGTGCSGCTICMMNKIEGKPAMIPSDVSGQGEKRVKLPDPVKVEQAREILKKVREAKRVR